MRGLPRVHASTPGERLGRRIIRARDDAELVFVGSALHDLGLVDDFMSPGERFELDGADAALRFMRDMNVPEERAAVVWDAIAVSCSIRSPKSAAAISRASSVPRSKI